MSRIANQHERVSELQIPNYIPALLKMITQLAHEYVHRDSVGNITLCRKTIQNSQEKLQPLYKAQQILGYQLLLITTEIDAEEKLIGIGDKFLDVTQGQYPFVYSLVQPGENNPINFDRIMEDLYYIRVDS